VVSAEATIDYDFARRPLRVPLHEDGITDEVTTSTSLRLTFNRFLLPHKIIRQSLCLRPSTEPVVGLSDCTEPNQPFTEPEYRPASRQVVYRLPAGTRLHADTLYRLTVYQTLDREPLPSTERYCAAYECFAGCAGDEVCEQSCLPLCIEPTCYRKGALHQQLGHYLFGSCASAGCHASGPAFGYESDLTASAGLDLSTRAGVAGTAIGVVAHGSQQGEAAVEGDVSPERFGRAMPLIDPGNPGNSYLLYKLIINDLNHQRPTGQVAPDLAAALGRLHAGAILGLPMPAESGNGPTGIYSPTEDPEGSASRDHVDAIQAWIAHGAPLGCE